MYIDYYLKFADAAEAQAILYNGEQPRYSAIDAIGLMYKSTGQMLGNEGAEIPEMTPISGWYVNVRHTNLAPELDAYAIMVNSPVRGWA